MGNELLRLVFTQGQVEDALEQYARDRSVLTEPSSATVMLEKHGDNKYVGVVIFSKKRVRKPKAAGDGG